MAYIDTLNKKKLFLDFDSTIFDSVKRICDLYNEDYRYYPDFADAFPYNVQKYDFSDVCPLAHCEVLMQYFSSSRFFSCIPSAYWMTASEKDPITTAEYIKMFSNWFHIVIVSIGTPSNLKLKHDFIKNHLPFADFIGIDSRAEKDKSKVDMADGIFIDDMYKMLKTSNAQMTVHYGPDHPWDESEQAQPIVQCNKWRDIYNYLVEVQTEIENGGEYGRPIL